MCICDYVKNCIVTLCFDAEKSISELLHQVAAKHC